MSKRKLAEELEVERLTDTTVLVRKLESLLVLVSAPAFARIEPTDAPDIRKMIRVVSKSHEESRQSNGKRGCSLQTLQAWVAEQLKLKDPQAIADLEMSTSLRKFAENDNRLLRNRMLVAQVDEYAAPWPPLRGEGQLGGRGAGGGGDGGGGGCLKCHGAHRLIDCNEGVALLPDGSENFSWQYDTKHPRREGGTAPQARSAGRPQNRQNPRQGGGSRQQQRHVPALMPPPA